LFFPLLLSATSSLPFSRKEEKGLSTKTKALLGTGGFIGVCILGSCAYNALYGKPKPDTLKRDSIDGIAFRKRQDLLGRLFEEKDVSNEQKETLHKDSIERKSSGEYSSDSDSSDTILQKLFREENVDISINAKQNAALLSYILDNNSSNEIIAMDSLQSTQTQTSSPSKRNTEHDKVTQSLIGGITNLKGMGNISAQTPQPKLDNAKSAPPIPLLASRASESDVVNDSSDTREFNNNKNKAKRKRNKPVK
jgi:hypothetical protein